MTITTTINTDGNTLSLGNLRNAVELNDKFRGAYFFSPPGSASARRYYEQKNSMELKGEFNGHAIEISLQCDCSCKNVYFRRHIVVDGRKTNITRVKTLIRKSLEA